MKLFTPNPLRLFLSIVLLIFAGCGVPTTREGDKGSDPYSESDSEFDTDTATSPDCPETVQQIYLLDSSANLYRFHPPSKELQQVATIDCDVGPLASPYSMAISRDGTAYILYKALGCVGIYPVSITTGVCGEKTDFACGTDGFRSFGMGFVTLTSTSTLEDLYIGNASQLAILDPEDWEVDIMGALKGNPEFTGNARGELWGFFTTTNPPQVARLDKNTGRLLDTWKLPSLSSYPSAWAFAFWGGSFYIFYAALMATSTNVYRVEDGVIEPYMIDTGKRIVGAGVSTCAPVAPVF